MAQTKPNNGLGKRAQERFRALKIILPRLPFVLRVAVLHVLGMSEAAKYLDLRSNLTIAFLRDLLTHGSTSPISKTQAMTLKDPGVKGRIWISLASSKVPPETDIRDALLSTIDLSRRDLVTEGEQCRVPEIVSIEAEWTGYRAGATPDSSPPNISEEAKYIEMMKEVKSKVTILYLHGGAYYLCDPITHRDTTKKLAKLTGGRAYSVRYRLAPQHPFPSALLDALISYFTLLYPPPGAFHDAVAPSDIVISGDSAGGNLTLALHQTLLLMWRQNQKITWFGQEREVPLPAGVALNSPWLDITQSLPSWDTNLKWDYLPSPNVILNKKIPEDSIWPAAPPRKYLYVDDAWATHPLVCLQLAESWKGSPPVYICTGWECLADEDKYLASKLARDGVTVVFEEYEAMPHVFAPILGRTTEAKRCYERWAQFISQVVEDANAVRTSFTTIKAKTCEEVEVTPDKLSSFTEDDLKKMAIEMRSRGKGTPEVAAKL